MIYVRVIRLLQIIADRYANYQPPSIYKHVLLFIISGLLAVFLSYVSYDKE